LRKGARKNTTGMFEIEEERPAVLLNKEITATPRPPAGRKRRKSTAAAGKGTLATEGGHHYLTKKIRSARKQTKREDGNNHLKKPRLVKENSPTKSKEKMAGKGGRAGSSPAAGGTDTDRQEWRSCG